MYHSIWIGNKNTWEDWHLVPTSRPVFNPPSLKEKTLEIPGRDGIIDLTTSLTGYPVYNNRQGSIEFIVMNDYKDWVDSYSDIMDYLHGQEMIAFLEDDPDYYYEGRFTVNNWKSDKNYSLITIDYNLYPYKWAITTPIELNIQVTTTSSRIVFNSDFYGSAPTYPMFNVKVPNGYAMYIKFINNKLNIDLTKTINSSGSIEVPEFVFYGDQVILSFYIKNLTEEITNDSKSTTMSISCKKGRL